MLENLKQIDQELLLAINGSHNSFWDTWMFYFSKTIFWLPLYLLILYLIIKVFKKRTYLILLSLGIVLTLADQIPTAFLKPHFQRLRPCHEPEIKEYVHVVEGCGGKYGFVSSHASNTFGVAVFLVLLLGKRFRTMNLLFLWAALVSFSRIYLGKHYPGDVIAGGFLGIVIGILIYMAFLQLNTRIYKDQI